MGRTLHYKILNPNDLTDKEKKAIHSITQKSNTGKFENTWTCESFWLDPLKSNTGFTKVGGNEFNALLVYTALIEISRLTNAELTLYDEGQFLYADVIIKNGLARIDIDKLKETWKLQKKKGNVKKREEDKELIDKETLQSKLIEIYPAYTSPFNLCRHVKEEDFKNYEEYNIKQLSAGFYGEYYGLNDKDPEKESYKACDEVKRMFMKGKAKIEITPKIKRDL